MLLLFMIVGLGSAWAEESKVLYTLDATNTENRGSNNAYASNCDVTVGNITWNVTGNVTMSPWRIGGKSISKVDREVYSKTAYSSALTKISLEIGDASSITIHSIKLIHSTNSDFSDATTINVSPASASKTYDFEPEGGFPANSYYKFVFNVTVSGTSNKFVEFKKVEFYGQGSGTTPETPTTYNINIDDKVAGGTISANPTTATEGTEVTLTATPSEGYEFTSWYVLDSDAEEITVTDNKFSMPASDVEVSATFTKIPEEDAPTSFYFKKVESQADIKYGETYIIVCEGEGTAMGSQSTNRRNNASVSINNGKIVTNVNGEGKPYEVTLISGSDGEYGMKLSNGKYLGNGAASSNNLKEVDKVANGYYWTLTFANNGNVTMITNHTTPRYLCVNTSNKDDSYATYTSIGSYKPVTLYKKVVTSLTITLNSACHDEDGMVYSTFSSSKPFVVSNDIEVSEIAIVDGELHVESYDPGDIVPANTGVMVSALEGGNYEVEVSDKSDAASVLGEDNRLRPSGDAGITADKMAANDAGCTYFRLTMHEGTQIGYWWGAEEGAAFGLAANKAYLAVPNTASVKSNLWFGKDATSISVPAVKAEDATIYNLAGQRVSATTKGIYIKNGKKLFVK